MFSTHRLHLKYTGIVQQAIRTGALSLGLALAASCIPTFAQHPLATPGQTIPHALPVPAAESTLQHAASRVSSGLQAFDNSPLANRMPLVLIHGIGGTESRLFHWENFLAYARTQKSFNQRYKIYLYHYDSTRSVPVISRNLQETLKNFLVRLDGRKIKILAYSEGGLLTRNAMQDPALFERTEAVLTIATPFHGSPLANPEWMNAQTKTESPMNIVRLTHRLAYAITGRKYPTFRQDFHWDNFDSAIPMEQYVKQNGPMVKTDYSLARKKNFITYGSYFGKEVDSAALVKELNLKKAPPAEKLFLSNIFKKNVLFSLVRNNIGKLPLAHKPETRAEIRLHTRVNVASAGPGQDNLTQEAVSLASVALADSQTPPAKDQGVKLDEIRLESATIERLPAGTAGLAMANALSAPALPSRKSVLTDVPKPIPRAVTMPSVSMMMYNDGISPISSTLWLGRYTQNFEGVSQPVDRLWATLKSLKGNRNTRLFAGLDHRNWMDGITRTGDDKVEDLLNPDEPPRSVFEWILHDLMGSTG